MTQPIAKRFPTPSLDKLPEDIYFRFANKYVYATAREKAAIAKGKLIPPEKLFTKEDFGLVSVQFNIGQIPANLKREALVAIEQQILNEKDKKAKNETEVQHAIKVVLHLLPIVAAESAEQELVAD